MRPETIARVFAFVLIAAGTSILAAPDQTAQPGQMTQAHVWIQNRGRTEAVPVELREVHLDAPLKVQIVNGEPPYQSNPVQVREIRRVWEYETITVKPSEDVASRLNTEGASGWEATATWSVGAEGSTTLLLKRAR